MPTVFKDQQKGNTSEAKASTGSEVRGSAWVRIYKPLYDLGFYLE